MTSQRQTQSKKGVIVVVNILVFNLRVQLQHCTYQRKTLLFALIKVNTFICKREISGFSSPSIFLLMHVFLAAEWRRNLPDRDVKVKLGPTKMIRVSSGRGQLLRTIDLRGMEWIILFLQNDREETLLSARMDREYDLVM